MRLAVAAPYPMAGFVHNGRFICVTGPPQLTPSCAMLPSAFIPLGGRCRRLHQSASRSPERMPRRGLPTAPPPAAVGSRSAESESPSSLRVLVSQSRPRDACLLVLRFWRRGIIGQLGAASPCVRDSSQPAPFCAAPSRPPIPQWRQSRRARASLFLSAGNRREGRALLASLALRLVAALSRAVGKRRCSGHRSPARKRRSQLKSVVVAHRSRRGRPEGSLPGRSPPPPSPCRNRHAHRSRSAGALP